VLPDGPLSNLPWQAINYRGEALADSLELVLAPSLTHHSIAAERTRPSGELGVFVGNCDDLPLADEERDRLMGLFGEAACLRDPVSRSSWPTGRTAAIWHYIGHAEFRSDNPFYSALLLEDGPMFAADFRIRRNDVDLVTLSACRTGTQTVLPGDESTGMVRALLDMGARNVLASHWSVADRSTMPWMSAFYTEYLSNNNAAAAARTAIRAVRQDCPSACDWAPFSVFGAG
jgi:CHAT domain-containing protein